MSKTTHRLVTQVTMLHSRIQQITRQGQVVRQTITTVITDTWTLVWAEEAEAAEDSGAVQFIRSKEVASQTNRAEQARLNEQFKGASEPPVSTHRCATSSRKNISE